MASSKCQALVTQDAGISNPHQEKIEIDIPQPGEHQVLVKVSHVAQNPTDVQAFDNNLFPAGTVLGCDFTGTVEKTGKGVTRVTPGDSVAGLIWGGETKGIGGYSQYTIADERISFPTVKDIPLDQQATVPLAACTALLALFSKDCLNIDKNNCAGTPVLIWGGSSSVGLYAVQIAANHGLEVITTCSSKHHDTVRALGAKHVFDYKDEDLLKKISDAAPNLKHYFDTIGKADTSITGAKALHSSGGTLCTVRPDKSFTKDVGKHVKVTAVLVWTAFLKEHNYRDAHWPISEGDHRLAVEFFNQLPQLLADGKIKPNKTKVYENGLDDVSSGFQEYRDGRISGYKIVYQL